MKKYLPIPVIIAVTLGVYFGAFSSGFFRDDYLLIIENKWLSSASYIPVIFTSPFWGYYEGDFIQGASNYYRPMHHLVNMATYAFSGGEPAGYHFVNVMLHILNAVAVYFTASLVLGSRGRAAAEDRKAVSGTGESNVFPLAAALIFALNPVNVDAVAWVAAVMELLFTLLCLVSFYLYARSSRAGAGATVLYALSVLSYAVGLLSKETAIFLPFLLAAYDYSEARLSLKSSARYMPYAIVMIAFLLVRSRVSGALNVEHEMTAFQYVLSVAAITGKYIGKLVFPFDLKLYYSFRPTGSIAGLFNHEVLISLILASVVLYSLYRSRDRRIALCVFWIIVPLSPAIFLIKYIQGEWVFASRYLYMPSAWFAILVALFLSGYRGAGRPSRGPSGSLMKAVPVVIVLPLLFFYSVDTVAAIKTWKDELSYWKKAVEDAPESATAHGSLGVAYAEAGLYPEAINEYEQALALAPGSGGLYMNIGVIYYNVREFDKALPMFRKALDLAKNESTRTNILFSLGKVYYQKGMFAESAESFEEAAAARGSSDDLYNWLGMAYAGAGFRDRSIGAFNEAIALNPGNETARRNLQQMLEARR